MSKKLTNEEFKEKARAIHGDTYIYDLVNMVNCREKIKIICKIHGEFEQKPMHHLIGKGCKKCAQVALGDLTRLTNKEFKEKAQKIHGNKYGYNQVNYISTHEKVKILCPKHGIFEQIPQAHLRGQGCPKCIKQVTSLEEFKEKANSVHNFQYDYSKFEYVNSRVKGEIVCKTHGSFWQDPNAHVAGKGCPVCNESRGEKHIRKWLMLNGIEFEPQKRYEDCRDQRQLPFDFYIPKANLVIEFQGIQHYKAIEIYTQEMVDTVQKHDSIKKQFCKEAKIKLLEIRYNQNIELMLRRNLSRFINLELANSNTLELKKRQSKKFSESHIGLKQSEETKAKRYKPVICLNDNMKEFESLKAAAEYYNMNQTAVANVCLGRVATNFGYQFAYKNDAGIYPDVIPLPEVKQVKDLTTEITYGSAQEAAKELDLRVKNINWCIKNNTKHHGHLFVFI
jgi:hypothetical protein